MDKIKKSLEGVYSHSSKINPHSEKKNLPETSKNKRRDFASFRRRNFNHSKSSFSQKEIFSPKDSLRIIPLGGNEEVGRNMTLFEYGKDIIILDMGLQFPEEDMPGIDYIIPNVSYLEGKEKNMYMLGASALSLVSAWKTEELTKIIKTLTIIAVVFAGFSLLLNLFIILKNG